MSIKRRFSDNAPLSVQQKNIWIEHEIYPENTSYNMVSCLRLSGYLNVEAFKKSLGEIVRRHEILRTTISHNESGPRQTVHQEMEVCVTETVLTMLSLEEQEIEIKQALHRESKLPFDLEHGPLFRFTLLSLSENEYVFLMTIHHLTMDGWSIALFSNELTELYEAFCNGKPSPLTEVGLQYSDYAIWQNDKEFKERDAGYWNDVFKDAVFGKFPSDYPREFGKKGESAFQSINLPADLMEKLKSFSREEHATPFIALLAGFQTVLHRYTGQDNLLLGCYTAGRDQVEIKELLGHYSNLAAIKTEFSGDPCFREVLKRTRRSFLGTFAHGQLLVSNLSDYQGDENSVSSTLFPVVFNFHNYQLRSWKLCDIEITMEPTVTDTTRFDMEITIFPAEEEWMIIVQYRKDIYSEAAVKRILNHYRNILSSAMDNPDQPVHELSMMSPAEIRQIVEDWNSEKAEYPTDAAIHQLIDSSAKEKPKGIALTYRKRNVSYQELINRSNYIAGLLIEMGVGPEVKVGVYMERSDNLIIALLAILKAGGVYVPLDPIYPDEKLVFMLQDSTAPILLTDLDHITKFPEFEGKIIEIESMFSQYQGDTTYDLPFVNVTSDNGAYLEYTSGTTGKPKGVLVTHRNVVNFFCFMNSYIDDADSSRVWLFSTSISFDPSVLEMFWTLSCGYQVVVLPNESSGKYLDIDAIPELIRKHHVSHFQGTPSVLSILVDSADCLAALKQLKKLMVGGESLPFTLAKKLTTELEIVIYNVYGPTEATIWATYYRLRKDDTFVPIGRPLPNYKIYILDKKLNPAPVGVYGELYIGGDGVARGYFNDPELTGRKYQTDPFSSRQGDRIYQTGDIARYRADGIIEFRGRGDRQIKSRGHRIELGEVEAAIMQCAGVREAVVIASGNTDIDRKLFGYVIPDYNSAGTDDIDSYIKNLKESLSQKLPAFMIPSGITVLKEFPKLSNGKIDRKSLSLPETRVCNAVIHKNVLSPIESSIMDLWEDVLGFVGFDIDDNFIDIGGNSLSAAMIVNRIKSVYNINFLMKDFTDNPTIKLLAGVVDQRINNSVVDIVDRITPIERNDDMPLSLFQERRLRYEFRFDVNRIPYLHVSSWFSIKLSGNLDYEALQKAFNYVINRHEVLRTSFFPVIETVPQGTDAWNIAYNFCNANPRHFLPKVKFKQSVKTSVTMNLEYFDLSKYSDEDRYIELSLIANDIIQKRYEYGSPPLTRAALARMSESEHVLIVAASHLIADGFSIPIYEKELALVYNALVDKQPIILSDIEIQYADYSAWLKRRLESGSLDPIKSYWEQKYLGYIPTDATILPFADIDGSENDPDFDIDAKHYFHPFSNENCDAIRKYAGSINKTVFSIV